MTRLFTICAAVSLSFGSFARAQDIPAEYQQVLTTLGKTRANGRLREPDDGRCCRTPPA